MTIHPEIAAMVGEIDFDPDALHARYLAERDKRLRDDHNEQWIEVKGDFSHYVDDPYVARIEREPVFDEVEVTVIGGGFGGLLMGARLREAGIEKIRVVESGGDFGGTWYWNRYPGAMCDVESYCYLPLLEELGYMPKHKYSFAPEILEHSCNIARHYRLYDNALLQTKIKELRWDEAEKRWIVTTDRGDVFKSQFVAMAAGPLNRPKLPGIPGIDAFKGHTFHTSRWDYGYTGGDSTGGLTGLKDKRVAIIGTGATAIQCIPHLGEWSKALYVFQRTPSSIDVRDNHETDPEWVKTLEPGWQARRQENFNILVAGGDQDEDLVHDGWTDIFRNLTGRAAKLVSEKLGRRLTGEEKGEAMQLADYKKMNQIRARVDEIVNNPDTAAKLKPWYRQFCKRPCFHDEYLQTYNLPNVHLVDTNGKGVERLTERGVVADGKEYEVDCIVFATGFEVGTAYTRRAGYEVIGRAGVKLTDYWADGMRTFQGLVTHGFPNCFFLGFTQTAITVSVPQALNEQAQHATYIITEAKKRGAEALEPAAAAEEAYVQEIRTLAKLGARFAAECTPGYYNGEGAPDNRHGFNSDMYGAGPIKFFQILADWRDEGDMKGISLR
jgi:cyclohexanone monooxygenase